MYDHKKNVVKALEGFYKTQAKKQLKTLKKGAKKVNKGPEKAFIMHDLLPFLRQINASYSLIEAKAVWSRRAGRYTRGMAPKGFPDIMGNFLGGWALYIEAKAPGKLNTIRAEQYLFLEDKILSGAFAVCVDNVALLQSYLDEWQRLMKSNQRENAKAYLLTCLPKKPKELGG